tara:strand:- start:220 stop:579 length:360 start_codon:yes stop_codon:yes gene_type:complete
MAPIVALVSIYQGGSTVTGVLSVFMTFDNDFTAYQGNHHDHAWGVEKGFFDTFFKRTRWLARNKFHNGSILLGESDPNKRWHLVERRRILGIKWRYKIGYHTTAYGGKYPYWGTVSLGW